MIDSCDDKYLFGAKINDDKRSNLVRINYSTYQDILNDAREFIVMIYLTDREYKYVTSLQSSTQNLIMPILFDGRYKMVEINDGTQKNVVKFSSVTSILPNLSFIHISSIMNIHSLHLSDITNPIFTKLFGARISSKPVKVNDNTTFNSMHSDKMTILLDGTTRNITMKFDDCKIDELIIMRSDVPYVTTIRNVKDGNIKLMMRCNNLTQINVTKCEGLFCYFDMSCLSCTDLKSNFVDTIFVLPPKLESLITNVAALTIHSNKLTVTEKLVIRNDTITITLNMNNLNLLSTTSIDVRLNELKSNITSFDIAPFINDRLVIAKNNLNTLMNGTKTLSNDEISEVLTSNKLIKFGDSNLSYSLMKDFCFGTKIFNSAKDETVIMINEHYCHTRLHIFGAEHKTIIVAKNLLSLKICNSTVDRLIICDNVIIDELVFRNSKIDNFRADRYECKKMKIDRTNIVNNDSFVSHLSLQSLKLFNVVDTFENGNIFNIDHLYYIINCGNLIKLKLNNMIMNNMGKIDVSNIKKMKMDRCYISNIKLNKNQKQNITNTLISKHTINES